MHTFFKRFTHKNEKVLRRELALAHTTIILLSFGMIGLLVVADMGALFDHALTVVVSVLLAFVIVISTMIVGYIVKKSK